MFLSSWEMHKTDLFRTPHWAKVIVRSVKVLRGTSIVSTIQLSNLSPNSASAADSTAWSWSVGRKWHLNLWPHGVLIASSMHGSSGGVRPVWLPGVTSGVTLCGHVKCVDISYGCCLLDRMSGQYLFSSLWKGEPCICWERRSVGGSVEDFSQYICTRLTAASQNGSGSKALV